MHRSIRFALLAASAAITLACGGSGGGSSAPTVPSAPTGLVATPGTAQVTLTWTAVSGATSYDVYWSTTPGVTKSSGTRIAGATSPYQHAGLSNGTTYYYVVTALNAAGESADSAQASAAPSLNPPPAAPIEVVATPGNAEVTLTWPTVATATSYNVYWSTVAGVTPSTGTKVPNVASPWLQTGLSNGTTYYYVVTAQNANGESTPSAEVSAKPLVAPYVKVMVLSVSGGGASPFGFLQQARVCTDATCMTKIAAATVTVNGTALAYDTTRQEFDGTQQIGLGATVTVAVTTGGNTYTATATQFSAAPTVSAPVNGATWSAGAGNVISWSGGFPTAGASYAVGVLDASGNFVFPAGGNHGPEEVPLSTTSVTVPASTLPTGADEVLVGIATTGIVQQSSGGIPIPGTLPGSGLWLGAIAPFPHVTVQ